MAQSAEQAFGAIRDFWMRTARELADLLRVDLSHGELADIAGKILQVARDEETLGVPFPAVAIDGHTEECVRGTVLDVHDSKSDIYATYKKATTLAKNILNLSTGGPNGGTVTLQDGEPVETPAPKAERYRHLCSKFCIGCAKGDLAVCVPELQNHIRATFAEGAEMDQIIDKTLAGDWELPTRPQRPFVSMRGLE